MQLNEKLGAIEAILFSCGEPVDEFRLAESAGIGRSELSTLKKSLNQRFFTQQYCAAGVTILDLSQN